MSANETKNLHHVGGSATFLNTVTIRLQTQDAISALISKPMNGCHAEINVDQEHQNKYISTSIHLCISAKASLVEAMAVGTA